MRSNDVEIRQAFAKLEAAAWEARKRAYAPYSGFAVGAAVETADGCIYSGCNIENVSYGLSNCAERTAIFTAVAQGARQLVRMVVCADLPEPVAPCGACRQVMLEFAPQMEILLVNGTGKQIFTTVQELLPYCFREFSQQPEKGRNIE